MRESVRELVRVISETLPISEPIYEFGALQVPGQESIADLRPLFPGKAYVGCDMQQGTGVDKVLDLHDIDLPDEMVGTVLMLDTLEHVEYPREAMAEVHRVLQTGGMVVMTSVMKFPIHDYPYDYWRFTPEAFRSLLKGFNCCFVESAGDPAFPHTVIGVGFKGRAEFPSSFAPSFESWKRRKFRDGRIHPLALIAYQLSPEFVRNLYRKGRDLLRGKP